MTSPYENNPGEFLKKFSMIVAASNNNVIGNDNKLLWHLPNDLKRFKSLTKNKIIIMGRNTFDSLPNGPLPQRLNIVLCNDDEKFLETEEEIKYKNTGIIKLDDISKSMNIVHNYELEPSMDNITTEEVFIIGGGKIYELFMPFVNKLYLTKVDVDIEGDTKIGIYGYDWELIEEEKHTKDEKHKYDYSFLTYKKRK